MEYSDASLVDEHAISLNGKHLSAKYWVIATGSSAAIPPVEGLKATPYITNREIFSLDQTSRVNGHHRGRPGRDRVCPGIHEVGHKSLRGEFLSQILNADDRDMTDLGDERAQE